MLDLHCHAVGQLVIEVQQHLLPDDLGNDEPFRVVGDHILREEEGSFRKQPLQGLQQSLDIVVFFGGDPDDLLEDPQFFVLVVDLFVFIRCHFVDLVDHQDLRGPDILQDVHDVFVSGAFAELVVYDEDDGLGVIEGVGGGVHHEVAQFVPGFVDPRCVHEYHLQIVFGVDAPDGIPGGLGFVRDDGDLLAQDGVQ